MTSALGVPGRTAPEAARARGEVWRKANRLRRFKMVWALLLGVCFWYAVPYSLPLHVDTNAGEAALREADAFQGNLSRQIAMPAALLLCLVALARLPARSYLRRGRLGICVLGYILWAITSLAWSAEPVVTRKRLIVFLIDVVTAYTLARLTTLEELAVLGFSATGTVALLGLVAHTCLLRDFRPWDPDFRFMGVMTANYQAINLFVCLTCGISLVQVRPQWVRRLSPLLALFAGLLFLTRARIGSILLVAVLLVSAHRWTKTRLLPHVRALFLLVLATVCVPGVLLAAGRDGSHLLTTMFMMGRTDAENTANLSNRAPLWSELSDSVAREPWLGVGFAAFWTPERVERISLDQGWVVPHAHNTYLDEVLSLGLIGGGLYLASVASGLAVAWRQYVREPDSLLLLPVFLLSWIILLGLTESIPLAPNLPTLLAYSCLARCCMTAVHEPIASPNGLGRRANSGRQRALAGSASLVGWQGETR